MPMKRFNSFADIINAFGGPAEFGRKIGEIDAEKRLSSDRAASLRRRDSIPPSYWPAVVAAARSAGVEGVTHETLTDLYATRRDRREAVAA